MRVWVVSERGWVDEKARRIEVEWQTEHSDFKAAHDRDSDFDPARHPCHYATFPATPKGRTRAVEFARSKVGESFFGCVTVREQHLEQIDGDAYDWETVPSSVEHVDGMTPIGGAS